MPFSKWIPSGGADLLLPVDFQWIKLQIVFFPVDTDGECDKYFMWMQEEFDIFLWMQMENVKFMAHSN